MPRSTKSIGRRTVRLVRWGFEAVGVLAVVAIAAIVILSFNVSHWLQVSNQPQMADYILPLAGDEKRLIKAAQLYQRGYAPKILLTSEFRQSTPDQPTSTKLSSSSPTDYQVRVLTSSGVTMDVTEVLGQSLYSTAEEAEAVREFISNKPATVILVASPYEARRTKLIFERTAPQINWIVVTSDDEMLPTRWWKDKSASLKVVAEIAKMIYYVSGGVFRAPTIEANIGSSG